MNKDKKIEPIDELIQKEKQIYIDMPQVAELKKGAPLESGDYQNLLKELILMVLPSPSQNIH